MKVAIPTTGGLLCPHFGHCDEFTIVEVEDSTRTIVKSETVNPPPHEPGVFPAWLRKMGCHVIIAGGMGGRAVGLFQQSGIEVVMGARKGTPHDTVSAYLNGQLDSGPNPCDDPAFHDKGSCGH